MESRFSRLLRLESEHCCVLGGRIERMETYRLQYVGLVVAGRKLVYVNAFCSAPPPAWDSTALVDACDGGPCYWGALYDPETGRFSELAFNGIGG